MPFPVEMRTPMKTILAILLLSIVARAATDPKIHTVARSSDGRVYVQFETPVALSTDDVACPRKNQCVDLWTVVVFDASSNAASVPITKAEVFAHFPSHGLT